MNRAAVFVLLVAGCRHELDGPAPTVTSVSPGLVCTDAEQARAVVTLSGDDLAPLVSGALVGDPGLALPTVELVRVADASGAPVAPGDPIVIPDEAPWITWVSKRELRLQVPVDLATGIYDVTVVNPDGQRATLAAALGVLPPPEVTSLAPIAVCEQATNGTITVTGSGFYFSAAGGPSVLVGDQLYPGEDPMGCTPVGSDGAELCTSFTFTVPAGDLPLGTYDVVVENPGAGGCESRTAAVLNVVGPPTIAEILPHSVCAGGTGVLTVVGTGFEEGAVVLIDGTTAAETTFVSDTELTAVVPAGTVAGTHTLTVQNADGCMTSEAGTFEATGGAFVFFVDPPVVWNGIAIQVTIYATLVTGPISTVEIQPHGDPSGRRSLEPMWSAQRPGRVRAVVPAGLTPGFWDVFVMDGSGCVGVLEDAFTVVETASLTLSSITPPFGWSSGETAVTIRAAGGLAPTPRAYLSPVGGTTAAVATALEAVAYKTATTLTAVVPAGLMAGDYDLIVVNPDGQVGVLSPAFYVDTQSPPIIEDLTPGSVVTNATPSVTILGSGFDSPSVTMTCREADGTLLPTLSATVTSSSPTQIVARVATSTLPPGTVCLVTVTNASGAYADFSALAVTNAAQNIGFFQALTSMATPRRGLGAVAGRPTNASRFLYAIAGDGGPSTAPYDTVEHSAIGGFGELGTFVMERNRLTTARSLVGAVRIDDFVYVVGGRDGAGAPLASVERARILDPLNVPEVVDIDMTLGTASGIGPGTWVYRIAAVFPESDPSNPGGETLPSDPFTITVPGTVTGVEVTLYWTPIPGAESYRVYRTPTAGLGAGNEELLGSVLAPEVSYTDDGSVPTSFATPMPPGSLGRWHRVGDLVAAREGAAVVAARHPTTPDTWYLYAAGGRGAGGLLSSYEFARVRVATDGAQTVDPFATGTASIGTARWLLPGWAVDHRLASQVAAGTTYLYFGGGLDLAGASISASVASAVAADGSLSFVTVDSVTNAGGAGATAANGFLFTFGGTGAVTPSNERFSAEICSGAGAGCAGGPPELRNWSGLGGESLLVPRMIMGTVLEGAFIYVMGGETTGGVATSTIEGAVW